MLFLGGEPLEGVLKGGSVIFGSDTFLNLACSCFKKKKKILLSPVLICLFLKIATLPTLYTVKKCQETSKILNGINKYFSKR